MIDAGKNGSRVFFPVNFFYSISIVSSENRGFCNLEYDILLTIALYYYSNLF